MHGHMNVKLIRKPERKKKGDKNEIIILNLSLVEQVVNIWTPFGSIWDPMYTAVKPPVP